jgi:hypothetical protein
MPASIRRRRPRRSTICTQVRDEIRRLDQFVDKLIELKLATRDHARRDSAGRVERDRPRQRPYLRGEGRGQGSGSAAAERAAADEAQEVLKIDSWLSIDPEGALWYRGLSTVPDDPTGGPFAALLEKYGAKRFVTGHTPQQNRSINVRFGGRAVLIDTGMLTSYYKGRASALEIDGDKLAAYYEDGKVTLP